MQTMTTVLDEPYTDHVYFRLESIEEEESNSPMAAVSGIGRGIVNYFLAFFLYFVAFFCVDSLNNDGEWKFMKKSKRRLRKWYKKNIRGSSKSNRPKKNKFVSSSKFISDTMMPADQDTGDSSEC
mmetsp:Transcript_36621/g.35414  ORF Transcript_36621/g.35414 Transcript_36621/m.35414 type:complete len:125 (-) Transcript_36621:97-471(-)